MARYGYRLIELCGTGSGGGLASGAAVHSPGSQCGYSLRTRGCRGGSGGDWWVTAEYLADVAQNIADIELKTAARAALVGMTVELLTVLSCWPNTATPAHALADLRTRRARMARHAGWFYKLPRHVRWLLAGTDRVQSLLAFAVSSPIMGEQSRRAWRKAVVALNEHAKSAQGAAPKPSPTHVEPEHTDLPGSSDLDRHRRATRCLRGTPETAPRKSVTTATAARVLLRHTTFARLPHLISS